MMGVTPVLEPSATGSAPRGIEAMSKQHFKCLERMYAAAPINVFFQPRLTVSEGQAEVVMEVREDFHHTAGAVHGSVYFKAMDDASFFAANSLVEDVFVLTASLTTKFLKPVVSGQLRAVGRVVDADERRLHTAATLYDAAGHVVGEAEGTFARSRIPLGPGVGYR